MPDGRALGGAAARVLCGCMGLDAESGAGIEDPWYETLATYFRTANVLDAYPGPRWPREEAARAVALLLTGEEARGAPPMVLLGRRVADAAGHGTAPYFDWREGDVVVLPHPSGLNRLLNDPQIRKATGSALWEAVRRSHA